jgi:hypothetical protein
MNRMRRDGIELCMNESLPDAKEDPAAVVSENGQSTSNSRAASPDSRCGLYALGRDSLYKGAGIEDWASRSINTAC